MSIETESNANKADTSSMILNLVVVLVRVVQEELVRFGRSEKTRCGDEWGAFIGPVERNVGIDCSVKEWL